ncbi:glycosyltransferase family 4 protein [Pontimonas sp.]|nr:glycosyltransferase family 4 protein [Pontimonas sp.]
MRVLEESGIPWVRTVRNYRFSCIVGTHFREGKPCFECRDSKTSIPAVINNCYRSSRISTAGALVSRWLTDVHSTKNPPKSLIFTTKHLRDNYLEFSTEPVETAVVGNPIARPPAESERKPHLRKWDCAFVGRLEPEKGMALVLRLVEELPFARFVIAGAGSLRDSVVERAARLPNLDYLGEVSKSDVYKILSDSRIALVPSIWAEPFGRSALEAAVCGVIPIVAKVGGLAEVMSELSFPQLAVSGSDVLAWKEVVKGFLDSSAEELETMTSALTLSARTKFSPEQVSTELWRVYSSSVQ